ncbi:Uncharacterised protein [uncultured archaeon]|nr:Uncharacterised protein [uncultured archaeon]
MKRKKSVWMRIPIFIVSGAILHIWGFFACIFALVQMILMLAGKKKEKELLRINAMFSSQIYIFFKYISFLSEKKPFPFGKKRR